MGKSPGLSGEPMGKKRVGPKTSNRGNPDRNYNPNGTKRVLLFSCVQGEKKG